MDAETFPTPVKAAPRSAHGARLQPLQPRPPSQTRMRQQERRVQRPPLDEPAQSKEHSSDSSAAAATASRSDGPADPAAPDAAPESKARQRHQQVVEACLHPSLPRSPAHAKQSSRPELLGAMRSTVSSLLGEALYVRETLLLQRVVRGWLGRASARREREWQEDELRADVEAEVRRELATSMQLPWPEPFQRDDLSVRLAPEARDVRLRVERRKRVRVLALTWNMHGTLPSSGLRLLLQPGRFHIVAVGTEECQRSIAASAVLTSKELWERRLSNCLGDSYVMLRSHTLQATHLAVFAHRGVLPFIHDVQSAAVATGIGNTMGNKGGVAVCFRFGKTSVLVVNSHLDSRPDGVGRRNRGYNAINQSMPLPVLPGQPPHRVPLTERFSRVIWMGDLNYRVKGTRTVVDDLLRRNMSEVLLANDQLRQELRAGHAFAGLCEGPLKFRPTYKLDVGTLQYDSSAKQRVPSWTDRVLFRRAGMRLLTYRSEPAFRTSDHLPVQAAFVMDVSTDEAAAPMSEPGGRSSEVCSVM